MNRAQLFFAALLLIASPAAAAIADSPPSSPSPPPVAQSIWLIDSDNAAVHQQSGLKCEALVKGFQRTRVTVYDRFGFDVSCNYVDQPHNVITIYLTRRDTTTLTDEFEKAKRELIQFTPEAVPLAESGPTDIVEPLAWQHIVYSENSGKTHSGIWMADLGGWTLEFRATYVPAEVQTVLGEMAILTKAVKSTAGEHLGRCAKSTIPVRDGRQVTDKDKLTGDVVLFGAMQGPGAIKTTDENGGETRSESLPEPSEWCAEKGVQVGDVPMLLWHAISPSGETQYFDLISVITMEPASSLRSALNPIGVLLNGATKDGKAEYTVSMVQGDEVYLYAVFDNQPDERALAALMSDWFHNRANPLAKVNPKTNNITVFFDPGQKD